jgi:hypothetical protein
MIAIRIAKDDWGEAWRAMIEGGPVHLVADDPIYQVLPIHLEILSKRGFTYEVVHPPAKAAGFAMIQVNTRSK